MSRRLPEAALRLFAHDTEPHTLVETAPEMVMGRLMEEGDSQDLRWLIANFSETRLSEWLDKHDRRLSRRSRAFWQSLLNRPDLGNSRSADDLWLL